MTLFFFNLVEKDLVVIDGEGRDLPDFAAVRRIALAAARDLMCADVTRGHLYLDSRIEVRDCSSTLVLSLRFEEAVTVVRAHVGE
jgi:hypothetical protein